jgi:hypothetical protein
MMRTTILLPVLLGAVACSDGSSVQATTRAPSTEGLAAEPCAIEEDISCLLSDLSADAVMRLQAVRDAREGGREVASSLPSEIDWAPDIYTAIERAKAQGRPILMTSVVNKGGHKQSGCDV